MCELTTLFVWTLFIFECGVMCGMAYLRFWRNPGE